MAFGGGRDHRDTGRRRSGRRSGYGRDERDRDGEAGSAVGRVPPSDVDAEKAVLSAIMLDNTVVHAITQSLRPDDFYHPAHQLLYQAMVDLGDKNQPVDVTVLADYLKSNNLLDQVGGLAMLAEIANYEATPANVE